MLHWETSALMVVGFSVVCSLWLSGVLAICAGIAKEIWDKKHGTCDKKDIVADLFGVVIGLLLTYLIRFEL